MSDPTVSDATVSDPTVSDAQSLLDDLRERGVQLWVHEGKLRVRPTGALDPAQTAALRAARDEVVALLEAAELTRSTPLRKRRRPAAPPLSLGQEGLWFLEQLGAAGTAYGLRSILRVTGAFDTAAFGRAVAELARRHEVLRTRYVTVDDMPVQLVDPDVTLTVEPLDLSGVPAERREEALGETLGTQGHFDLASDVPFRVRLIRLGDNQHLIAVDTHHIVIDGPSLDLFHRQLGELYTAFTSGRTPTLPEPKAQYADYAVWQRDWLRGPVLDEQLTYWKNALAGAPQVLDLPTDRPRPAEAGVEGDVVEFTVPPELTRKLVALGRDQDATLFMVLLAAFQTLLARWAGQHDVSVGIPVDVRGHEDTEDLIGYFLNTLVVRSRLTPRMSFADLVRDVRAGLVGAYDHRDLPFDRLVAELCPQRDLSRHPLFQALFTFLAQDDIQWGDLDITRIEPDDRTSKFDLSLFVAETGPEGGLNCGFEYATALFDRESVERLVRAFSVLLEGVVADVGVGVADVALLSGEERRELVAGEWNATGLSWREDVCLHELFEEWAAADPDAVAVVCGDVSLSYRELSARADGLAWRLRAAGVGPESLVGVCVGRSVDVVVGLLGVLKAGGGYVPLDPAYPAERLAFMVADSGARVVVTESALRESVVAVLGDAPVTVVCVDEPAEAPAEGPLVRVVPSNVAYCIYTSGSTGRPKGVALAHANAVAFVGWAREVFGTDLSRVLAATSVCFDLSVFELFGPLCTGGTVVLVRDGLVLAEGEVAGEPVLVNTVPSAARAVVDAGAFPKSVRVVNLAGEPLPTELARRIHEAAPEVVLNNLYGPTEYTTYATWCEVEPGVERITVGGPVANTSVYLLDERGEPVPVGVGGEVHLAGAGLARGYWNRPGLTAERFVPDPFGPPGTRMYRTGDLARYLPDGRLEYLGRMDAQVKVRGFRIELGEIENVLLETDGVAGAVAAAPADPSGDRRLVGYLVLEPDADGEAVQAAARDRLEQKLPSYMIPGQWVLLDELPLTPNGKTDRRALPAPGATSAATYMPPSTPTEQALAAIWTEVLHQEGIGIHDNFFSLGGHSLLATQVVARIRRTLHADVDLRELFTSPTVAQLAEAVGRARPTQDVAITPGMYDGPAPVSWAQQRMWFIDQLEPDNGLYNVPFAWRIKGPLDVPALEAALDEVIRRHEVLRSVYASHDGLPVPQVLPHTPVPLAVIDVCESPDPQAAVVGYLDAEARHRFDLELGPLVRTGLIRLAEREHILMVSLHHIVADGWSFDVLLTELSALYGAFREGRPSPLPELPVQYADYAAWQAAYLQGDVLERHLDFWRDYLDGAPPSLELPTDRPRPRISTYEGAVLPFELSAELSDGLREMCERHGVTLFMLMAAAFNVLLHRYSRQDDLCVGYVVGNRDHIETEGLIGLFVNTLVMRSRIAPGDTFLDVLNGVRESLLDADAHKDLPFEKLVEELRPQRDLSRHPIFQVSYSYSTTHGSRKSSSTVPGFGRREIAFPGAELGLVESDVSSAKFDLSLFVSETGAGNGLEGDFEFSTDLFDRESVERLVGAFSVLLEGVVADVGVGVADVALLSGEERRELVAGEWNATGLSWREDVCLHELFEEWAAADPDAVAVVCGDVSLSYGELSARADGLAWRLRAAGVGPESLVGVCVGRSVDVVVGLLGVLKAGGGYVALDPAYPAERLAFMVADSGARVVVTESALRESVVAVLGDAPVTVVCVDEPAEAPAEGPLVRVVPSNVAYCIYTSGSTGRPKGVALAHANAVAFVGWAREVFGTDLSRVLAATSVCFDLSVFELFGPLCTGGTVVLVRDALALTEERAAGDLLNTVPSAARALVDAEALPASVRVVNLAGEPLPADLAGRIHEAIPGVAVNNLYGPTEYTTYATWCEVEPDADRITIGRPVANTAVYLLDERGEPVPVGVGGEVYLAGAGLARGYWNRPGLTAERFVPDPFGPPGKRMYRTGDVARYLPDGRMEYLGRLDEQVKLRGFRIELGEIETVLLESDGVLRAAAMVREDTPADPRLVGYVVLDPGRGDPDEVMDGARRRLADTLPTYMIPQQLVTLDELPLTPNGKTDRRALPAPEATGAATYTPPSTPTERALAAIWGEVLHQEGIGIEDNFFALGGHSLLATQVIARIRKELGVDVRVQKFFESSTIAAIATLVDSRSVGVL